MILRTFDSNHCSYDTPSKKDGVNLCRMGNVNMLFGSQQMVSVMDYGASPSKTPGENKAALQAAIADVDSRGRGIVVVPPDIKYGIDRTGKGEQRDRKDDDGNAIAGEYYNYPTFRPTETQPDFSNCINDVLVIDYSVGDGYGFEEGDGLQVRNWTKTKDELDGSNDGNTYWFRAKHAPALMLSHDGEPPGHPDARTNRRATIFFNNNGVATWGIGQGVNTAGSGTTPVDADDDELTHFKIIGNDVAGVAGLTSLLTINKKTGFFGFNTQNQDTEYHFIAKRGTKGQVKFESLKSNMEVAFKTSTKERAFTLRDDNGNFNITNHGRTSNVMQLTDKGNMILQAGVTVACSSLPTGVGAGTIVFHSGAFKGYNGSTWVTLG